MGVCRLVRRVTIRPNRLQSVPIVVIAGADAGEGDGLADVVLQKPFEPVQLGDTVRSLRSRSARH